MSLPKEGMVAELPHLFLMVRGDGDGRGDKEGLCSPGERLPAGSTSRGLAGGVGAVEGK